MSTLMFASRCMAVKTTPVQHEEVDYAEMCVRLQEKIGSMENELSLKLQEQQDKYETIMQVMQQEVGRYMSYWQLSIQINELIKLHAMIELTLGLTIVLF